MTNFWSAEEIDTLMTGWPTKSARQIADALSARTREAVIGKANRLRRKGLLQCGKGKHFEVMPWPERQHPVRSKGERGSAVAKPKLARPTPMITAPPAFNGETPPLCMRPCSLLDLDKHRCRWPLGDVGVMATEFCGGQALDGLPYCAHHCGRAYHHQGGV
jgi:GcrA cell cycle regulator